MKKTLNKRSIILVGITLFSMFFGSGNLIFPPYLGFQAGGKAWFGLLGFALTAIICPVLAVIAIARFDDLPHLAGKAGKKFAIIFTILAFLSIGPCLAIPRNAAVSFEMAVVPFVKTPTLALRIIYSLIFFGISYLLCVHPESLTDTLGKILGPVLLGLMLFVAVLCMIRIPYVSLEPTGAYADHQVLQGFLDGYQTMDTIAALNFGNIIALNIIHMGIKDRKEVVSGTMKAGIIAGILLFVVYAAMMQVGVLSGIVSQNATNGANVLTNIVGSLLGNKGIILLGVIYVLACLTTCVGLLCSCAEYFASISKMSYKKWIILFTVSSFAMSIVGLDQILKISVPILNAIYPVAMVLVLLGQFKKHLEKHPMVFPSAILLTGIVSVIYALSSAGIRIPYVTGLILSIPPTADLCWLIPAAAGIVIGWVLPAGRLGDSCSLSADREAS
ncbi:MAG: branched-chain amino acid transport system II carrier protein [Lactimicrobium massiliense]|nr:branched-chain amino acid transport system II carrier protein [Lactimicrobium massiliense]MDD6725974.1 branched-chain amino acid transport system II carrier protein [Lactimicrobium massiliense]